MVFEVFDDGKEPTRQELAMMRALMEGGMFKYSYKEDGTVDIDVIPLSDIYPEPPKEPQ